MAGTTYLVAIDLQTKGNLVPAVRSVESSAKSANVVVTKLNSGFDRAASGAGRLFGMFDGVMSRVADVGIGLAKWGVVGAAGGAVYGVMHLNNELESTKIALGAIFDANGVASGLPMGMKMAQDVIAKMRVDAQKLPGEFEDLRNIFTTTAIPGFQSGASIDSLRELSGKLMAFAKVAQLPMDQAAREAAQLLEGRAGAHNVLGMKLAGLAGDKAQSFNKESPAKRLAEVTGYLDKYKSSIDAFGRSWEGVSSTSIDYAKQFVTVATQPLFESAKDELSEMNEWFMANRQEITKFGEHLGFQLKYGFEVGVEKIKEWWPAVKTFSANAYDKIHDIFVEVEPYVERFGSALQSALKDPGTIDKLIMLAKIWAAGKAIGVGANIAGGVAPMLKFMGAGWGLGDAAGAAGGGVSLMRGAGKAVGAVGNGVGTFMEAKNILGWGPALAGGAEVATAALLPLAPAAIAVGAAFAAYEAYQWFQTQKLESAAVLELDRQRSLGEVAYTRIETLSQMNAAEQTAIDSLYDFISALDADRLSSTRTGNDIVDNVINPFFLALAQQGAGGGAIAERQKARNPSHPGGGGGTHIAKIEITVSGNDEPNRVAALVVDKFNKQARHRRTSPDVPNYAASRG